MEKLKLEPVSALVMRWGRKAYKESLLQNFIDHLDLSSANDLYRKCSSICDWYEEVVINKKYFINRYIGDKLSSSDKEHLGVILAAGKDPLALNILIMRNIILAATLSRNLRISAIIAPRPS